MVFRKRLLVLAFIAIASILIVGLLAKPLNAAPEDRRLLTFLSSPPTPPEPPDDDAPPSTDDEENNSPPFVMPAGNYSDPPAGSTVRWGYNGPALSALVGNCSHFSVAAEQQSRNICTTADIILAATATGLDTSTWNNYNGQSPLEYLYDQVYSGWVTDAQEISCVILATKVTGQDPTRFGGQNLVRTLSNTQNRWTGQFGNTIQSHAYAILALHNTNQPIPAKAVEYLQQAKTADGGWANSGTVADTETTALVIQALLVAGDSDMAHSALSYLHRVQNIGGGFNQYNNEDSIATHTGATALVLQALNLMNEPLNDWTPNSTADPIGGLFAQWDTNTGGYYTSASSQVFDLQSTARAIQATEGLNLGHLPVIPASKAP